MSALLALFGLEKVPAWLCELLAAGVACLVLHFWWVHHNHVLVDQGRQEQQNDDNAAAADLKRQTDAESAALAAAVATKETERAKAESDAAEYRRTHPLDQRALLVCRPSDAHGSGSGVRAAASVHGGGSQAGAAEGVGQSVPAGVSPSADDRLRLLDAFGALFDDTDRQVDGLQTRLGIKPQP